MRKEVVVLTVAPRVVVNVAIPEQVAIPLTAMAEVDSREAPVPPSVTKREVAVRRDAGSGDIIVVIGAEICLSFPNRRGDPERIQDVGSIYLIDTEESVIGHGCNRSLGERSRSSRSHQWLPRMELSHSGQDLRS